VLNALALAMVLRGHSILSANLLTKVLDFSIILHLLLILYLQGYVLNSDLIYFRQEMIDNC